MHHSRHKEILILIRKINSLDEINSPNPDGTNSLSLIRPRRNSEQSFTTSTTTTTSSEVSSECGEEGASKMKRSERKKAKKLGLGSGSKKSKIEAFSKEDTDLVSEALHLRIHETKGGRYDTYNYHNKQPEVKGLNPEDQEITDILDQKANLSVKSSIIPTALTPRQRRDVKKCSTIKKHQNYHAGSRKFSLNGPSNDPLEGLDPQIFFRLNVDLHPKKNTVARKELVSKLIAAVKNDLVILAQEDAETETRAEGFWRWAGKSAWEAIMERREGLDWVRTTMASSDSLELGSVKLALAFF